MRLTSRAIISVLAGVGAGLIGFQITWWSIKQFTHSHPGIGHDVWLLVAIFAPFIVTTLAVFRTLSPTPELTDS